jgi:hypothetical protein
MVHHVVYALPLVCTNVVSKCRKENLTDPRGTLQILCAGRLTDPPEDLQRTPLVELAFKVSVLNKPPPDGKVAEMAAATRLASRPDTVATAIMTPTRTASKPSRVNRSLGHSIIGTIPGSNVQCRCTWLAKSMVPKWLRSKEKPPHPFDTTQETAMHTGFPFFRSQGDPVETRQGRHPPPPPPFDTTQETAEDTGIPLFKVKGIPSKNVREI